MALQKPDKIDVEVLKNGLKDIEIVRKWGYYLAENSPELGQLSSSQLRKFFGAVKKIQADFENQKGEIVLLEPKLAYAVGRDFDKQNQKQKTKVKEFYELLRDLIRHIGSDTDSKKRFKYFVDVFESIVAFHKEKEEVKPVRNL